MVDVSFTILVHLLNFTVLAALTGGVIILQIYLSKRKSKLLGLILPAVSFIIPLVIIAGIAAFSVTGGSMAEEITYDDNGNEISRVVENIPPDDDAAFTVIVGTALPVFVISNIPTGIFLVIYFICRKRLTAREAVEKMKIQDLE